jgi:subtilisin family serine protease
VVWSHGKTGIAVVTSDDPGFADAAQATGAFQTATLDFEVQWLDNPSEPQAITPGDETFFPLQWNMQAIEAPAAWATGCTGAGVRVAINDGGIYDLHADLAPNLDTACSASFVPGQPFNTDTGTFWHGTHVAGIVGAADNGFGVIGVAPEAELIGVKVLHDGSGSFGGVIGGILYAADPAAFGRPQCAPADIINMSLGAAFFKFQGGAGPLVGALAQAVNFATSQGVLVISAAGNNGVDIRDFPSLTFVPADSGSGLAVSATGPVDFANGGTNFRRPASYSNFGDGFIDVAAPGGDFTLFPNGLWFQDMVLSTCRGALAPPNFSFCFAAGTSMASPAAAGVAALIKSTNPGMSLGALKAQLRNTADDEGAAGTDSFYGHGFVNAFRACTE